MDMAQNSGLGYNGRMKIRILVAIPLLGLYTLAGFFLMRSNAGRHPLTLPLIWGALGLAMLILTGLYLSERDRRRRESRTDPVTGIRNRLGFVEGVHQEMERAHRYGGDLAVIVFSIDQFEHLREWLGAGETHRILTGLTEFLTGIIRSGDLFARVDIGLFTLVLPHCGEHDALKRAERVADAVRSAIISEKIPVTLSLGVTGYRPGEALETLMERAHRGLDKARQEGGDRVFAA